MPFLISDVLAIACKSLLKYNANASLYGILSEGLNSVSLVVVLGHKRNTRR